MHNPLLALREGLRLIDSPSIGEIAQRLHLEVGPSLALISTQNEEIARFLKKQDEERHQWQKMLHQQTKLLEKVFLRRVTFH